MHNQDLLQTIDAQWDAGLPFVVYRKPGETNANAIFLEDAAVVHTRDYTESGFVFAPFDEKEAVVLFPARDTHSYIWEVSDRNTESYLKKETVNVSEKDRYIALIQKGILAIKKGEMEKVVLSRKHTQKIQSNHPRHITERLLNTYLNAFVYCWYHPKVGLWAGATPETLLSIAGSQFKTMALAGTQTYEGTLDVTWRDKEKQEQQLVTDTIMSRLGDKIEGLNASDVQTHKAGSLLHLKTLITGRLGDGANTIKDIVNALHPTPAVCGLPRKAAKAFILNNEDYNRAYYTGFIGEVNIKKETKRSSSRRNVENLAYSSVKNTSHLFVNLRCMQLFEDKVHIYVGGGVTTASNAQSEWEETVNKLQTMGKVLD